MWSICLFHDGSDAYATIATLMKTRAEASCQIKPQTKSAFGDFKGLCFVIAHGLRLQSRNVLGRLVLDYILCYQARVKDKGRVDECNGVLR